MECKFATNGLAIDYFGTVKPCCAFRPDDDYRIKNNIKIVNLANWQQNPPINKIKQDLSRDIWPVECSQCQQIEEQNRGDSIRLNAASAYQQYTQEDITLEIRGGSVCNFACQTCWPQASSRVAQFYQKSNIDFVPHHDMDWTFDHLDPIKHRLRDIVLLGGEPFYDRRCLEFLSWTQQEKINAALTIFTNGSVLDQNFLRDYPGKLTIVFSIDAVGSAAEYIRFGSIWDTVQENYEYCRRLSKIETRVNITTSPYNYYHLPNLIEWLAQDWPAVVSFGMAGTSSNSLFMDESVFPLEYRDALITRVIQAADIVKHSDIESMQQANAIGALESIAENLKHTPYDQTKHDRMRSFIHNMDRVKNIDIWNYCPEIAGYLDINPTKLA